MFSQTRTIFTISEVIINLNLWFNPAINQQIKKTYMGNKESQASEETNILKQKQRTAAGAVQAEPANTSSSRLGSCMAMGGRCCEKEELRQFEVDVRGTQGMDDSEIGKPVPKEAYLYLNDSTVGATDHEWMGAEALSVDHSAKRVEELSAAGRLPQPRGSHRAYETRLEMFHAVASRDMEIKSQMLKHELNSVLQQKILRTSGRVNTTQDQIITKEKLMTVDSKLLQTSPVVKQKMKNLVDGQHKYDTESELQEIDFDFNLNLKADPKMRICYSEAEEDRKDTWFDQDLNPDLPENYTNLKIFDEDDYCAKSQKLDMRRMTSGYKSKGMNKLSERSSANVSNNYAHNARIINPKRTSIKATQKKGRQQLMYSGDKSKERLPPTGKDPRIQQSQTTREKPVQRRGLEIEFEIQFPNDAKQFLDKSRGRFPTTKLPTGAVYIGPWENQQRNGFGLCVFADKSFYIGEWKNGMTNGTGKFTSADQTVYQGIWVNNKMKGKGSCIKPNGASFEGDWLNHMPHGRGIENFPDNSSYRGHFVQGMKEGIGQMEFPDGGVYKGQFQHDKINGKGTYHFPNGITYIGQWVNNNKEGEGILRWDDNSRDYKGEFKNDLRHGYGEYSWLYGTKQYRGQWRFGKRDGIGFVRDEFEFIEKKGQWYCGKLIKWLPLEVNDMSDDIDCLFSEDQEEWDNNSIDPCANMKALKEHDDISQKRMNSQRQSGERLNTEVAECQSTHFNAISRIGTENSPRTSAAVTPSTKKQKKQSLTKNKSFTIFSPKKPKHNNQMTPSKSYAELAKITGEISTLENFQPNIIFKRSPSPKSQCARNSNYSQGKEIKRLYVKRKGIEVVKKQLKQKKTAVLTQAQQEHMNEQIQQFNEIKLFQGYSPQIKQTHSMKNINIEYVECSSDNEETKQNEYFEFKAENDESFDLI